MKQICRRLTSILIAAVLLFGGLIVPHKSAQAVIDETDPLFRGSAYDTVTYYRWTRMSTHYFLGDLTTRVGEKFLMMLMWQDSNGDWWYTGQNKGYINDDDDDWYAGAKVADDRYINPYSARFVTDDTRGCLVGMRRGDDGDNWDCPTISIFVQPDTPGGNFKQIGAEDHWYWSDADYLTKKISTEDFAAGKGIKGGEYWKWMVGFNDASGNTDFHVPADRVRLSMNCSSTKDLRLRRTGTRGALFIDADTSWNECTDFYLYIGEPVNYSRLKANQKISKNIVQNINGQMIIPEEATLIVEEGGVLSVEGMLINNGLIINRGTIVLQADASIRPFEEDVGSLYRYDPSRANNVKMVNPIGDNYEFHPGSIICEKGSSIVLMGGSRLVCGQQGLSRLELDECTVENFGAMVTTTLKCDGATINNHKSGVMLLGYEVTNYIGSVGDRNSTFGVFGGVPALRVYKTIAQYGADQNNWGRLIVAAFRQTGGYVDVPLSASSGSISLEGTVELHNDGGTVVQK